MRGLRLIERRFWLATRVRFGAAAHARPAQPDEPVWVAAAMAWIAGGSAATAWTNK
jgi:hypothetical protein